MKPRYWSASFPLEPTPYGRSRIAMRAGRPIPIKPAKTRRAMDDLKLFISKASPVYFEGPVEVLIVFTFVRPKSVSVKKRPFHTVKPDLDNLCKTVFDAATGILWRDDTQVVNLQASKQYGDRNEIMIVICEPKGVPDE